MNLEHAVLPRVLPCALLQEKSEPGPRLPLYGVQKGLKEHSEMEALAISSVNLITVLIADRAMETKSHCGVPAPCCVY